MPAPVFHVRSYGVFPPTLVTLKGHYAPPGQPHHSLLTAFDTNAAVHA